MSRTAEQQAEMDLGYVGYRAIVDDMALWLPWREAGMDQHPLKERFMVAAALAVKKHVELAAKAYGEPRSPVGAELTLEELAELPRGSVVSDADDDIFQKRGSVGQPMLWCSYETAPVTVEKLFKYGPIRLVRYGKGDRQ